MNEPEFVMKIAEVMPENGYMLIPFPSHTNGWQCAVVLGFKDIQSPESVDFFKLLQSREKVK